MEALRRLPARVFGVLMSLEPAVAALAGFLVLGRDLTVLQILGIALVVVASAGAVAHDGVEAQGRGPGGRAADVLRRLLARLAAAGQERRPLSRSQLLERAKPSGCEPLAQRLGRYVDRGRRAGEEGEDDRAARGRDAGELREERDHVQEYDDFEESVGKGKRSGVGDLEADTARERRRKERPRLLDHRRREVDPDHVAAG